MPAPDDPHPKPGSAPVDPRRIPRPLRGGLEARRDAVIARLQDGVSAGHLGLDELDERLALAMRAQDDAELDELVADLPALTGVAWVAAERPVGATTIADADARSLPAVVPSATEASPAPTRERLTAFFSGIDRKGRRTLPRQIRARALFGGITLDLREASFQPGVTVIRCLSCFGGVDITVPPHVRVEVNGSGIFGGFDGDTSDAGASTLDVHGEPLPPRDEAADAPVLRVEGTAIFGGVSVRRKEAESARERQALARRLG
jgi:hypothetical protein